MGLDHLQHLATGSMADIVGAVGALLAELKAARWERHEDLTQTYPSARISGPRVEIDLDDDHCVTLLVNYGARCVLIEAAGGRLKPARAKKGK